MIDRKKLLADLQSLVKRLEADLLERSESKDVPEVGERLRADHKAALDAKRTAQNYEDWRSDWITQTAAAWALSCVFVRFLEDNGLVEPPRISGPDKDSLERARDEHRIFFEAAPLKNDRDYLIAIFDDLAKLPGARDVFGPHNPLRELPNWLSGDAGGELLRFFQKVDANTGNLVHDFTDPKWDTRFLGDLYQDLSEAARKKYALLQTPEFVEEFILERTLEPALHEFGLEQPFAQESQSSLPGMEDRQRLAGRFKMIDPACGSGHFLLGSFRRILDRWQRKEPGTNVRELAQRALDSVHGVDVNPYAVAIARFRLLIAAMQACGVKRLKDAPDFKIRLACGDSLLHAPLRGGQLALDYELKTRDEEECDHVYFSEDLSLLKEILRPKQYHAVVANPPYIVPKDRTLNERYRRRFVTCHMKYSLAVPFLERIFRLAIEGGYTGQITANSFMKREFGKKLIEQFLPTIDLTHVLDTSGAYLPGHGTPTTILFGRHRKPVAGTIRAVMGIRGEPGTPHDPAHGHVWSAVVDQVDQPGSSSDFVSVSDLPRERLCSHPWAFGGGGGSELKEIIESRADCTLASIVQEVGVFGMTNADEVIIAPGDAFRRRNVEPSVIRRLVIGDEIRDWSIAEGDFAFFPYADDRLIDIAQIPGANRWLWLARTVLGNRATFSRLTYFKEGRPWWEWHQVALRRLRTQLSIAYAFVATHNRFVFDRCGSAFNRSAPIIKLAESEQDEAHFRLLGVLNCSVVCFWIRLTASDKGMSGGVVEEQFERFFMINGTQVEKLPIPHRLPDAFAVALEANSRELTGCIPSSLIPQWRARLANERLDSSSSPLSSYAVLQRARWDELRQRLVSLQEELDWECYRLYGLIDEDLTTERPPEIELGQRAFEIVLARRVAAGEEETAWFARHGSQPITELPVGWTEAYRRLVERRIELIESDPSIGLIERPEYKRRWNTEPWEAQLGRALRDWLLSHLESLFDFDGRMNDRGEPTARLDVALTSVAALADLAKQDSLFLEVGSLYKDDTAFDVERLVDELVRAEQVPLLPVLRYKPSGLRKRAEWEQVWDLQRKEDAIDALVQLPPDDPQRLTEEQAAERKRREIGDIPVPPKYAATDFVSTGGTRYWSLRGKLDVPKERWVSFPHCEGPDGTLVIAWAGYDHLQLARAISAYYVDVQERLGGRDDPRLVPLLASLAELLPWLKQWHNAVDPDFGVPMGDYFDGFLLEEARNLPRPDGGTGWTVEEIKAWEPAKKAGGRKRKGAAP